MFKAPEKYRHRNHAVCPSSEKDGCNGMFIIPHYRISNYEFRCFITNGSGWEHMSVTIARVGKEADRTPTWAEMCWLKDLFWDKDDCVIQIHPPESEHISTHDFCLHIWRPVNEKIPTPPSLMVGRKDLTHEDLKNKSPEELRAIMKDANPKK